MFVGLVDRRGKLRAPQMQTKLAAAAEKKEQRLPSGILPRS
jgi:hypothetical protein